MGTVEFRFCSVTNFQAVETVSYIVETLRFKNCSESLDLRNERKQKTASKGNKRHRQAYLVLYTVGSAVRKMNFAFCVLYFSFVLTFSPRQITREAGFFHCLHINTETFKSIKKSLTHRSVSTFQCRAKLTFIVNLKKPYESRQLLMSTSAVRSCCFIT